MKRLLTDVLVIVALALALIFFGILANIAFLWLDQPSYMGVLKGIALLAFSVLTGSAVIGWLGREFWRSTITLYRELQDAKRKNAAAAAGRDDSLHTR